MSFRMLLAGMCSLCLLGAAADASAREFILKPDRTQAAAGETVGVQAQAAQVFMVSEEAEPVGRVVIELLQGSQRKPVQMSEDAAAKALSGKAVLPAKGTAMLVGHRLPRLWCDTTEGVLEGTRKALEARGMKVLRVGKYENFAKALLNPAVDDTLYRKKFGPDLEIVLLTNPATLRAGEDVRAEVLLKGKPLKAAVGLARDGFSAEKDTYVAKGGSGADGVVSFKVDNPGLWMLRTEYTESLADGSADKRNMRATYVFPVK